MFFPPTPEPVNGASFRKGLCSLPVKGQRTVLSVQPTRPAVSKLGTNFYHTPFRPGRVSFSSPFSSRNCRYVGALLLVTGCAGFFYYSLPFSFLLLYSRCQGGNVSGLSPAFCVPLQPTAPLLHPITPLLSSLVVALSISCFYGFCFLPVLPLFLSLESF